MKSTTLASTLALLALATLLAPLTADGHISLHPNTIPAGAFATLDVRVPGEQEAAHVTRVDVLFPPGFTGVDYERVPGWRTRVIEAKLSRPIKEDGETIDSEVSQVVWTWTGPLGQVADGQFVDFPLSLAIPADSGGRALEFRTVQSYSNGQVVRWIDPSLESEHPSPRINVTAKGGMVEDLAGDEAGPRAGQAPSAEPLGAAPAAAAKSSTGASTGLTVAALILGAVGALAGGTALLSVRRGRA
jgi:uncharacterized protein YcnI